MSHDVHSHAALYPTPTAAQLLADPTVSFWLKDNIKRLNLRDVLDAINDAELLLATQKQRYEAMR